MCLHYFNCALEYVESNLKCQMERFTYPPAALQSIEFIHAYTDRTDTAALCEYK